MGLRREWWTSGGGERDAMRSIEGGRAFIVGPQTHIIGLL
jgi:hypothetical protein